MTSWTSFPQFNQKVKSTTTIKLFNKNALTTLHHKNKKNTIKAIYMQIFSNRALIDKHDPWNSILGLALGNIPELLCVILWVWTNTQHAISTNCSYLPPSDFLLDQHHNKHKATTSCYNYILDHIPKYIKSQAHSQKLRVFSWKVTIL